MTRYLLEQALLPDGWAENVAVEVDSAGVISAVTPGAEPRIGERIGGCVIPGFVNAHSHAFQYAMAGLAEDARSPEDDFWSWRETMYALAGQVSPEDLRAIAGQLYIDMLKAGYTGVAEFHYLHHGPGGQAYTDPAAMTSALFAAAGDAGIAFAALPVLYMRGGFDGRALADHQRRFGQDLDGYLHLLDRAGALGPTGVAFHSLRAVPPEAFAPVLAHIGPDVPVHLHIAEQTAEVDDCLAATGQRPVEWLLDHCPVSARWHLVHATHMTAEETRQLAATGAHVVICPTTEANLGDGLFPLETWRDAGGRWSVGSDSHVSINPWEELRWLEYGQRLFARRRVRYATPQAPHTGAALYGAAVAGGAAALGRATGAIAPGHAADWLVLAGENTVLETASTQRRLDSLVFAGNANSVRHVMVGGRWCVRDGHHAAEDRVRATYVRTVRRLFSGM